MAIAMAIRPSRDPWVGTPGQPLLARPSPGRYLPAVQTHLRRAVALALPLIVACGHAPAPPDAASVLVADAASAQRAAAPAAPAPAPPVAAPLPRDPGLPPLGVAPVGAPRPPEHVGWIAAGGGATPVENQISIEDDLSLAAARFGGPGVLLFAGGPGSHGVQVSDASPRGDGLVRLLGDLFDPRGGRDTHYQPTRLRPHGPATVNALLDALSRALDDPAEDPLTLYLAGHGAPAARREDVQLAMWGGRGLVAADLAATIDRAGAGRPVRLVRLVMTSCFSGAFADVLFTAADPTRGPAAHLRCGLFAAPWDRPSSGCDPDPDRRLRAGYGFQLLHALAGEDTAGTPLDPTLLDLDHDGRITLLEAHTRARIAGAGFDVPTTTSERWLRHVAAARGWPVPRGGADHAKHLAVELPEEDAVITALGVRLGATDEPTAAARVATLKQRLAAHDAMVTAASDAEAEAGDKIAAAALARWPVLDDPWHPDYAATLATERDAITTWFETAADYHAYLAARDAVDAASDQRDAVLLELAPWLSLQRAFETRRLAGHLAARGGPEWDTFLALRGCERGAAP